MRTHASRIGLAAAVLLVSGTACDNVAIVSVVDARVFREPDNRLVVDVDLRAAEQSGKSVGPYCVSAHVVPFGFDTNTPGLTTYRGQVDVTQICADDLHDGDTRTFRLVLGRTDILTKNPIRVQTQRGRLVEDWLATEAP